MSASSTSRTVKPGSHRTRSSCIRWRERYATPEEAESLIAAVPQQDRTIWATAMFSGLRLGELRALRVEDINLATGVIHVERGWDPAEGAIELKSRAGRRKVPIAAILRDYLAEHLARSERRGSDLIFGNTPETPFTPNMLQRRADQAWAEAGLERLTPHACRHSFASAMIAAGVNAKALSTFMGHANISITLDRYGAPDRAGGCRGRAEPQAGLPAAPDRR